MERRRGAYHRWTDNEKDICLQMHCAGWSPHRIHQDALPHISSSKISKMLYNLKLIERPKFDESDIDQNAFKLFKNLLITKQDALDYFHVYIHVVPGLECTVGPVVENGLFIRMKKEPIPIQVLEVSNTTDEIMTAYHEIVENHKEVEFLVPSRKKLSLAPVDKQIWRRSVYRNGTQNWIICRIAVLEQSPDSI